MSTDLSLNLSEQELLINLSSKLNPSQPRTIQEAFLAGIDVKKDLACIFFVPLKMHTKAERRDLYGSQYLMRLLDWTETNRTATQETKKQVLRTLYKLAYYACEYFQTAKYRQCTIATETLIPLLPGMTFSEIKLLIKNRINSKNREYLILGLLKLKELNTYLYNYTQTYATMFTLMQKTRTHELIKRNLSNLQTMKIVEDQDEQSLAIE